MGNYRLEVGHSVRVFTTTIWVLLVKMKLNHHQHHQKVVVVVTAVKSRIFEFLGNFGFLDFSILEN